MLSPCRLRPERPGVVGEGSTMGQLLVGLVVLAVGFCVVFWVVVWLVAGVQKMRGKG